MKSPSAATIASLYRSAPETSTAGRSARFGGVRLAGVGLLSVALLELSGCSIHASASGKTAATSNGGIKGESSSSAVFQTKPRTSGIKRAKKDPHFQGNEVFRVHAGGSISSSTSAHGSASGSASGSGSAGAGGSASAHGSASGSGSAGASGSASAHGSGSGSGSASAHGSGSGAASGSGNGSSSSGGSGSATGSGSGSGSDKGSTTKEGHAHKDKALAVPAGTRQETKPTPPPSKSAASGHDKLEPEPAKPTKTTEPAKPTKSEGGTKKTKEPEPAKTKKPPEPATTSAEVPKAPTTEVPEAPTTEVAVVPVPVSPPEEVPAPPVEPIEPPAAPPENVFGYEKPIRGCFEGVVYPLHRGAKQLPTSYDSITPISLVYACEWDIPAREWKTGFPGIPDHFEWFAIRYSGSFSIEQAGSWTFRISSDDGSRLLIDGKPVIFNDGVHPPRVATAKVDLAAGDHEMVLEYFQGPRFLINLQLFATPPGGEEGIFSVR